MVIRRCVFLILYFALTSCIRNQNNSILSGRITELTFSIDTIKSEICPVKKVYIRLKITNESNTEQNLTITSSSDTCSAIGAFSNLSLLLNDTIRYPLLILGKSNTIPFSSRETKEIFLKAIGSFQGGRLSTIFDFYKEDQSINPKVDLFIGNQNLHFSKDKDFRVKFIFSGINALANDSSLYYRSIFPDTIIFNDSITKNLLEVPEKELEDDQ